MHWDTQPPALAMASGVRRLLVCGDADGQLDTLFTIVGAQEAPGDGVSMV